jgi:hypothetical protein
MTRHPDTDPRNIPAPSPSRTARLHRLLFAGAALGTTLLALGAAIEPKLPPFQGE